MAVREGDDASDGGNDIDYPPDSDLATDLMD